MIRKYINHRKQVLKRSGLDGSDSRFKSLRSLDYAFSGPINRWSLEGLPRIIQNWKSDLLNIAPGPKSKFYKSQTSFLIDLISWAEEDNTRFLC